MREARAIVVCAVDAFLSPPGRFLNGFREFAMALDEAGIPAPWFSRRNRLLLDDPRRSAGHSHPFIAEGGSGVYLPEDYFHLRPAKTVRLGRFTAIPVAQPHRKAAEALEALAEETAVAVVPLRSLSPRELTQNSGLALREAELLRQRDFDELFFFAGSNDADIRRFAERAREQHVELRQDGVLWSLSVGASSAKCLAELSRLYDRAQRHHMHVVGLAAEGAAGELLPLCETGIVLTTHASEDGEAGPRPGGRVERFPLHGEDGWDAVLDAIKALQAGPRNRGTERE